MKVKKELTQDERAEFLNKWAQLGEEILEDVTGFVDENDYEFNSKTSFEVPALTEGPVRFNLRNSSDGTSVTWPIYLLQEGLE